MTVEAGTRIEEILPDKSLGMQARGGVESLKGMRYPSLRTDSTQDSDPIVCQYLQCADRQPPTCNRSETPSGGLFRSTLSFATRAARAAGGRRKGLLAFESMLRSRAHLGQGRVKQGGWEKSRRRGKVGIT